MDSANFMSTRVNDAAKSFTDLAALNDVKKLGREQNPEAIMEVARQFESFFITQLMKEMRAGVEMIGKDNFTNSSEMRFHQQMFDQQLSMEVADKGGYGLAELLAQQLTQQFDINWAETDAAPKAEIEATATQGQDLSLADSSNASGLSSQSIAPVAAQTESLPQQDAVIAAASNSASDDSEALPIDLPQRLKNLLQPIADKAVSMTKEAVESTVEAVEQISINKDNFFSELKEFAVKAAKKLGVDSNVLMAQAALETGWGEHISRDEQGSSHNLFNIKSSSQWGGQSVKVTTLEYRDGVAQKEQANFRSYDSFEDSFNDYADFIMSNPRYEKALSCAADSEAYVQELQKAGYATDPDYAQKILQLLKQPEFK